METARASGNCSRAFFRPVIVSASMVATSHVRVPSSRRRASCLKRWMSVTSRRPSCSVPASTRPDADPRSTASTVVIEGLLQIRPGSACPVVGFSCSFPHRRGRGCVPGKDPLEGGVAPVGLGERGHPSPTGSCISGTSDRRSRRRGSPRPQGTRCRTATTPWDGTRAPRGRCAC